MHGGLQSNHAATVACPQDVERPGAKGGPRRFATFGKDPTVRSDFLPDKDREREEEQLRQKLKQEWETKQARRCWRRVVVCCGETGVPVRDSLPL